MAKERIITGIDVGSTKVSTTVASVLDNRISVIGVSGNVPSKDINKGKIANIDSAVECISASLERAERMAGGSVALAFVTISGSHIETTNSHGVVAVSPVGSEITPEHGARGIEAARAVSLSSSREIIHVIPRDFIVDSQDGIKDPVGMSGIRLEVETNIIHGLTPAIKNLTRCIQQVGVDVESIIYTGIASAEAVLTDTEKELGTVLIDFGGGVTSIIAFLEGSPVYSSVLPIGAKYITNDLAIGLRTRLDSAEKVKIKLSEERVDMLSSDKSKRIEDFDASAFGLDMEVIPRRFLYEIIDARLNEIFKLVNLEMAKANLLDKLPSGVVITGGGALTYGIEKVAKNVLKMPARLGYPGGVTGLIDEIQGPAFSANVGAILYGVRQFGNESLLSFESRGGNIRGKLSKFFEKFKSFLP